MNNVIKVVMGFAVAGVIAISGYFTKAYTVDEAVAVVTDTSKATEACVNLLSGQGFKTEKPADNGVATVKVIDDAGEVKSETSVPVTE